MKTQAAIDRIKSGGFLMAEFDEADQSLKYRCVPGGGVSPRQAASIIKTLDLKPNKDALFEDFTPQSWRL